MDRALDERIASPGPLAPRTAKGLQLAVAAAPNGTTVHIRASDDRPPLVVARPLSDGASYDLPPGFYSLSISDGQVQRVIELYARPGATVRFTWGAPDSPIVADGVLLDRSAAEKAWTADLKEQLAALADWDGEGELPAGARRTLAAQRAAIAELGDVPHAHLSRLRHASYVAQLTGPEDAWGVIASIPPDSVAWAAYSPWFVELQWFLKDVPAAVARFEQVRALVVDMGLHAAFTAGDLLAAERSGQPDDLAKAYRSASIVEGPLVVGEPMPRFELGTVEGDRVVRSIDLLGTPYLLEVWSTWCEPCIAQMEKLHALHKQLGGDPPKLRMISVAVDSTRAPIQSFRQARWPMPWTNVWAPDGEPLFTGWSLSGVPYAVLVGADGRIQAAGPHVPLDAQD